MKKYLLFASAVLAFASCTSDTYLGDQDPGVFTGERAIDFGVSSQRMTRADLTGPDAAALLNQNFVVYGYKTVGSSPQVVFDNYQVKFANATGSSAGSTESNTAGWEYVSYKNLPFGTTTTSGGTLNNEGVAANATGSSTNIEQSIKYWDYSATAYDFFAYSLGAGVTDGSTTWAKASAMSNSTYTLEGTAAQLGTCYISKKKTINPSSSSAKEVDLEFVSFLSKIQLKFFEIIPGYSVKDVKFYTADGTKSTGTADGDGLAPAIYTASTIPTGGLYTITFDSNNDPVVTLTTANTTATSISFPAAVTTPSPAWLSDYAARDYKEAEENVYLGRTASAATASKQITVLPNSTGATLTLKMDYTLLSRDGTGETIQVTGATATIPADYTKWKSNYVYTYIFKISDNTNGSSGQGITGLYPITLDAIVAEDADGSQTTVTTVATPSITTYQSGAIANEYNAGNIYVTVGDGSTVLYATGASTNAKLYTATIEEGAAQGIAGDGSVAITEEMVANALTKTPDGSGNYVLTDANGKDLTVTPVGSSAADKLVGELTAIPATDAPGGKELAVKCASFEAVTNTVYVFEYIYEESSTTKKAYKVIKVGTPTAVTPGP